MQKEMPRRGQSIRGGDSMSVDGTNAELFEDLMSDVSAEEQQELRKHAAARMRKEGMPEFVIEVMLGQPSTVPQKS